MCDKCNNTGWVCERCGTQWEFEDRVCCGAGIPCDCNPDAVFEFETTFASTDDTDQITLIH